jgi:DNA polymerase III delta prime subunit
METLNLFIQKNKIPNIIFHGPNGSGKKTMLYEFIHKLYKKEDIDTCVMFVNCIIGKGIKFIREDIKSFSKQNIHYTFKSVVLLNAEKLTSDAQFALRRCVELFNHTTRFFIVTTDKYKLIKPILSRFSELYIFSPINLYTLQTEKVMNYDSMIERPQQLQHILSTLQEDTIWKVTKELYGEAYSALDLIEYVSKSDIEDKDTWCLLCSNIQYNIYDEQLLMYILLHSLLFRKETIVNLFM